MIKNGLIQKAKKSRIFSEYLTGKTLKQLYRYIVTGLLSAGVEFSLLYVLKTYAGFSLIASNSVAYTSGFCVSFLMNKFWAFESKGNFGRQFLLYGVLFTINLALSNALMYLLTERLGIMFMVSKVFVTGMIVLWNFVLYKKIIYR